jgi:hypothetical protein
LRHPFHLLACFQLTVIRKRSPALRLRYLTQRKRRGAEDCRYKKLRTLGDDWT